jgi:2,3-dihydroxybiphenyl 1,2-dioxygenase
MTIIPSLKLGYVVIESERLDAWEDFARAGLGLDATRDGADLLILRLDDRERRIVIRRGPAEDVVSLGWELDDAANLAAMCDHLSANGVTVVDGGDADTGLRGVPGFFGFIAHKGLAFEFFCDAKRTNQPLEMKSSGFVTGPGGLGHAVLFSRNPEALVAKLERLLGVRVSDTITDRLEGIEMEFTFLHLNERHHTLAVGATAGVKVNPIRTRIQHMMIEAQSLDDVSAAYLRCKELGYPIALGMGQHPNDKVLSFYAVSPSGFEVEIGCDPVKIGEDWEVGSYRGISKWGHDREHKPSIREKLGMAVTALKSLRQPD